MIYFINKTLRQTLTLLPVGIVIMVAELGAAVLREAIRVSFVLYPAFPALSDPFWQKQLSICFVFPQEVCWILVEGVIFQEHFPAGHSLFPELSPFFAANITLSVAEAGICRPQRDTGKAVKMKSLVKVNYEFYNFYNFFGLALLICLSFKNTYTLWETQNLFSLNTR